MELVEEEVFDPFRAPPSHGAGPQVAAEGGELAAEWDHLELEHEPGKQKITRAASSREEGNYVHGM